MRTRLTPVVVLTLLAAAGSTFHAGTAFQADTTGNAGTASAQRPMPEPRAAVPYNPVTSERLLRPEPHNWLSIRRTYDGWAHSPLAQITPANVATLRLVWTTPTGQARVHESAPLVNDGLMFVTSPANQVLALDARTGAVRWRYQRPRPPKGFVLHDTNRGVALYGDKVYFAAGEAVLVALDAHTGREVWSTTVADNQSAYYLTLAPLVAKGLVMIGASGGEFGVRGFIAAYDPDTGKQRWRTYTVPAPGEPGSHTWPKGNQWRTGGAPVWVTGTYDPESGLSFWGTGNGGPWIGDQRPGDNLYVASTVAIDVATGAIKGHFQYNPNESWDWDEVSPPLVVDYERDGRTIKGLVNVSRSGYVWFLERPRGRGDGVLRFVEGQPFVTNTVYRGLDPVTGRPDVDPAHKPGTGRETEFCPGSHGGKNWPPAAFNPQTRMIYFPVNNNVCGRLTGLPITYKRGTAFSGTQAGMPFLAPGATHVGEVQAWNVDTGRRVWTHEYGITPNWGSMLSTAGGVIFTGGTSDRRFHAFDAASGRLLWQFQATSGIVAPPTSFAIDGTQYIAVESGWGGDPAGMQRSLNRIFPDQHPPVPEGGAVWVFALP